MGLMMPVTARLSKLFYDRLGEAVTNELVDWFNQVDAAYKFDIREMNELNFARFDAKLEQRITRLEAKFEQRFVQLEAKFEQRFVQLEAKFEQRFVQLEAKFDQRLTQLDAKIESKASELIALVERSSKEQTRFLVLAWAALLAAIVPLWFR
jgi:ABC-type phosphate transport system auxiliary subunit